MYLKTFPLPAVMIFQQAVGLLDNKVKIDSIIFYIFEVEQSHDT